jgi:tRNA(Ile)-lysidine synthase
MRQFTDLLPPINPDSPSRWWVGFSGGLDSTVLLHLLLSQNLPVSISAIHINHQISPNADAWQQHCEAFCQLNGIQCISEKVRVENQGNGIEDAAREARYQVFAKYLSAGDLLFTAHHADDQAETLLLRLLRGTGVKGLSGIAANRAFGDAMIYRPLLSFTRDDLLVYAKEHKLDWIEDESNQSEKYDRNYLRLQVMPVLQQRWPGLQNKWQQTALLCAENNLLLQEFAQEDLKKLDERIERVGKSIEQNKWIALSHPRQRNLLVYWLESQGFSTPEQQHWQQIDAQFFSNETDLKINVQWGNVSLRVFQNRIYALPNPLPSMELTIEPAITSKEGQFLKANLPNIHSRQREGGERCRPFGRAHSQTLKKCLQEYGLEPWFREGVPLIYSDDNLVAVGDLWICADYVASSGERGLRPVWKTN